MGTSCTDWDAESSPAPEDGSVPSVGWFVGVSAFCTLITSLMEGMALMGFMPGLTNVLLEILGVSEMASL